MTLELLQEHGYDRLTVDAVAAAARASKATVYRRWPSKSQLVLAAIIDNVCESAAPPDTGTLRGDLLRLGKMICEEACRHAGTIRAVGVEMYRNPALNEVVQQHFVDQQREVIQHVLQRAADRGEIKTAVVDDDLSDLLSGYLVYRCVIATRPPTQRSMRAFIDGVVIPNLTRTS